MSKPKCSNTTKFDHTLPPPYTSPCQNEATTWRNGDRYGDPAKGEPAFVRVRYPLCAGCARDVDDLESEIAAESHCS